MCFGFPASLTEDAAVDTALRGGSDAMLAEVGNVMSDTTDPASGRRRRSLAIRSSAATWRCQASYSAESSPIVVSFRYSRSRGVRDDADAASPVLDASGDAAGRGRLLLYPLGCALSSGHRLGDQNEETPLRAHVPARHPQVAAAADAIVSSRDGAHGPVAKDPALPQLGSGAGV
eukprot:scaffold1634_cov192-Pinguiococcus_pyrenoidosus.AAC.2